jgi:aminoglycoside phosphotransferase family enzyme/predicted kinase
MDLESLIRSLSDPAVYGVDSVEVHQTHISVVFLADEFAYKIKKPVALGFLDFSTLEKRHHFCEEEVRLNRRLAPSVYLGVVPVTASVGGVRFDGDGEIVEWAVKMERLPTEASLQSSVRRGDVGGAMLDPLARRIASFHAGAAGGPRIASFARFEQVARNARENFEQSEPQVGVTVSRAVFERLRHLTEAALDQLRPTIEARADAGVPRDTHGDLRLDHVYSFRERPAPGDLVIIDCIEFNERFRFADPVADIAFLVMDLIFEGRRDLARTFDDAYFAAAGDGTGRSLLPFYVAYRAVVRGKVEGFELVEREIPQEERDAASVRARAHWLLALGELEEPARKPCLILVGGLPGSGKSTLAQGLAARIGADVVRSDVVRKELAGLSPDSQARAEFGEGIYSPEWSERTYAECRRRTDASLFEGKRVVVDSSFGKESHRRAFLELARRLAVPAVFFVCQADAEVIRARLAARKGDASDADWSVYVAAANRWEPPTDATAIHILDTGGAKDAVIDAAIALLMKRCDRTASIAACR